MKPKPLHRIAAALAVRALRWPPARRITEFLARAHRQTRVMAAGSPVVDIPEIGPLIPRIDESAVRRLNLLVPSVSARHVFGGIQTALLVFDVLRDAFDCARIITTDDSGADRVAHAYYSDWPVVGLEDAPPALDHIVTAGARSGLTLAVGANDVFLVTAWWTAHNGFDLLDWQRRVFPSPRPRRLAYLIQDFEPGFYPWSTRYALADATYRHPESTVAIINSRYLADYMAMQGYAFPAVSVLEPRLNPELARVRAALDAFGKEPVLLVYGRPGVERNAFGLLVAGLRAWVEAYPRAREWTILSAGEPFADIDLGRGCSLRCVGKLDIAQYADLLVRTAVGVSLMISPHPSYPPLELAAFGAQVITNRFANKNLETTCSAITALEALSPRALAQAIERTTCDFDNLTAPSRVVRKDDICWHDGFLEVDRWASSWPVEVLAGIEAKSPLSDTLVHSISRNERRA